MPTLANFKTLFRTKTNHAIPASPIATPEIEPSSPGLAADAQDGLTPHRPTKTPDSYQVSVTPASKRKLLALDLTRPNAPIPPTPFTPTNETEREMLADLRRLSITAFCNGDMVCSFEHDVDMACSDLGDTYGSPASPNNPEYKAGKITFMTFSPGSALVESPTYVKSTIGGRLIRSAPESPSVSACKVERTTPVTSPLEELSPADHEEAEVAEALKKEGTVMGAILSGPPPVEDESTAENQKRNEDYATVDEREKSKFHDEFLGVPAFLPRATVPNPNGLQPATNLSCPSSFTSTLVPDSPVKVLKSLDQYTQPSVVEITPEDSFQGAVPYAGIADDSPVLRRRLFGRKRARSPSSSLSSLGSLVSVAITLGRVQVVKQPVEQSFENRIASIEEELRRQYLSPPGSQASLASSAEHTPASVVSTQSEYPPCQVSLDDLQLIKVLGKGASGQVYMVKHKKWNTRHALKIAMDVYDARGNERRSAVSFLKDEQAILKKVGGQNGFLRLDASWSDTRNFYFLFPLYATDLESEIQRTHGFPVERARFYFAELTIALHDLHTRGIIHRDVKPANMMLDYEGHLILGDFGLSEDFGTRPSLEERTHQPYWPYWSTDKVTEYTPQRPVDTLDFTLTRFCGSPHHLAPEIWLEKPYSFGVDWWAAATVLFNMVTGRVPFWTPLAAPQAELKAKVISENIYFRPGEKVDAATRDILHKMLKKKPENRLPILQIQSHPFFHDIDWNVIKLRQAPSPYVPPRNPTHVVQDYILEFVRGNTFAEGGNPYPEFEYTSPPMLVGAFHEKEKMQDGDVEEQPERNSRVEVLGRRKFGIVTGLLGRMLRSPRKDAITFSMHYPPEAPQRFYVNQQSIEEGIAVNHREPGVAICAMSFVQRSLEQLGRLKNRIRYAFVPRVHPRPANGARFDLLE